MTANEMDERNIEIAAWFCRLVVALEGRPEFLPAGMTVADLQFWIKGRAAAYEASRSIGLLNGVQDYGRPGAPSDLLKSASLHLIEAGG